MMSQEDSSKLENLHKQGRTIKEIAAETEYHWATISKQLKGGSSAAKRAPDATKVTTWRYMHPSMPEALRFELPT